LNEQYNQFRVTLQDQEKGPLSIAKGKGAVSSVSKEATELAVDVLKDGGNAFDASFMLALGLSIYHPQAGSLGGGGYLLFKEKGTQQPVVYNYRECSPQGAKRESFLYADGSVNPDVTAFGPRSVCVPGTLKAFFTLQKEYGLLNTGDLLRDLAGRAETGCTITNYQAQCLNRLRGKLALSPESRRIYVKEKGVFQKGDRLSNSHLKETFLTLAEEGEKAFYEGSIAELIEHDLTDNGGFVTVVDLKKYQVKQVMPIVTEVNGRDVWTVPPEGGGALLIQILNILNRDSFFGLKPFTTGWYHSLAQAFKIAFIDRMDYLGDIDLTGNKTYADIFKRGYSDFLYSQIDEKSDIKTGEMLAKLHKGELWDMNEVNEDDRDINGGAETTHFSVIDHQGNAVSNSYTLNLRYGSKWSVENAGFLLNGSMDAFSFYPGKSNYFQIIGNKPNLFAPWKRPASNMSPVLITNGSEVELLAGTPGGPTIPTTLSAIILSVLGSNTNPMESIMQPRIHHQGWPDVLYIEPGRAIADELKDMQFKGYTIKEKNEPIGDVHGILKYKDDYLAVSDYRREGWALSY